MLFADCGVSSITRTCKTYTGYLCRDMPEHEHEKSETKIFEIFLTRREACGRRRRGCNILTATYCLADKFDKCSVYGGQHFFTTARKYVRENNKYLGYRLQDLPRRSTALLMQRMHRWPYGSSSLVGLKAPTRSQRVKSNKLEYTTKPTSNVQIWL